MNEIALTKKDKQGLQQIYAPRFSWIVIGYNEEISKLYRSAHAQFLDLKFNKADRNSAV